MDRKRIIIWAVIVLTLAFILGQSLLSKDLSIKQSTIVQEQVVEPVHKAVTGEDTISFDVRNIAHAIEFALLGLELVLLFRNKKRILRGLKSVSYCGFFALIDESIQYFSGRAPQVVDIWYDILGAVVGSIVGAIVVMVIGKIRTNGEVQI